MEIFNEKQHQALVNICRVAAERFREHVDHVSRMPRTPAFEETRQIFVDHMLEALEFAEIIASAEKGLIILTDENPDLSEPAALMQMVERYVKARIAEDRADTRTLDACETATAKAKSNLEASMAAAFACTEPSPAISRP